MGFVLLICLKALFKVDANPFFLFLVWPPEKYLQNACSVDKIFLGKEFTNRNLPVATQIPTCLDAPPFHFVSYENSAITLKKFLFGLKSSRGRDLKFFLFILSWNKV